MCAFFFSFWYFVLFGAHAVPSDAFAHYSTKHFLYALLFNSLNLRVQCGKPKWSLYIFLLGFRAFAVQLVASRITQIRKKYRVPFEIHAKGFEIIWCVHVWQKSLKCGGFYLLKFNTFFSFALSPFLSIAYASLCIVIQWMLLIAFIPSAIERFKERNPVIEQRKRKKKLWLSVYCDRDREHCCKKKRINAKHSTQSNRIVMNVAIAVCTCISPIWLLRSLFFSWAQCNQYFSCTAFVRWLVYFFFVPLHFALVARFCFEQRVIQAKVLKLLLLSLRLLAFFISTALFSAGCNSITNTTDFYTPMHVNRMRFE